MNNAVKHKTKVRSKMTLTFKEKSTLGLGWSIEVLHVHHLIGNIRKAGNSDLYLYFHGPINELNYEFQDTDLEVLKRRVSEKYGR